MIFEIELTDEASSDVDKHKKSGDKKVLIKIDKLLDELRTHPTTGTGKPEILKHYKTTTWSRRISEKHRMVYRIENEKVIVLVLSLYGHYDDK
ncbi:Txe/YoeB family addiction module toxin [Epilithonimonas sp.]|uniref:Txe/YoeB family addiction module toxin n=1 Tax=Epilithonimonas sp. TaxID=2894511 RepID=UPI00289F5CB1|nr:Txe/YoeB family addiction module toxin [Epilithonimonas sp.]